MTKILILAVAVVVIVLLLKRAIAGRLGAGKSAEAGPAAAKEGHKEGQGQLVACAHCGVNLPQSEARGEVSPPLAAGAPKVERYYCSEAHLRAGPRKR